jgi:DNA-directed RNA polymerase subunit E'/Rpb7
METITFFEKKIILTPRDLNQLKHSPINTILLKKAQDMIENKCCEHGFVLPGSVKIISRSMGYFESARFTGDTNYYVKLECLVIYPVDGMQIVGEVLRKNKMGLFVNYNNAIKIQVPRDLHIGNEEFSQVQIGHRVKVEIKRSKFTINDPYILSSGLFIMSYRNPELDIAVSPVVVSNAVEEKKFDEDLGDEEEEDGESEVEEDAVEEDAVVEDAVEDAVEEDAVDGDAETLLKK